MKRVSLRLLLPRLLVFGFLLGLGLHGVAVRAEYKCPDCYRCDGGCYQGTNTYGFTDCVYTGSGCEPNGGNPCCQPE